MATWFYDESRKLGIRRLSASTRAISYQSRTLGHLANPKDVEKAALKNPDLTFIVYHSASSTASPSPITKTPANYDPVGGDFAWHNILMDIKKRNPQINNVYPEIGSFFGPPRHRRPRDVPCTASART